MKFELKTEKNYYSKSVFQFFGTVILSAAIIIFCDFALKLGRISRYYQVNYFCNLLTVEKSSSNFKRISSLSNLKSKQRILEFCRRFVD